MLHKLINMQHKLGKPIVLPTGMRTVSVLDT